MRSSFVSRLELSLTLALSALSATSLRETADLVSCSDSNAFAVASCANSRLIEGIVGLRLRREFEPSARAGERHGLFDSSVGRVYLVLHEPEALQKSANLMIYSLEASSREMAGSSGSKAGRRISPRRYSKSR